MPRCATLACAALGSAASTPRPVEFLLAPALDAAAPTAPSSAPPPITSAMAAITAALAIQAAPSIPLKPSTAAPTADTGSPGCSDYDRRDGFTCAQQASWGCERSWMAGFCDRTCGRCGCGCACSDASPREGVDCR